MSKGTERRASRTIHSIVAIILLLGGGALLAFGIWLQVSSNNISEITSSSGGFLHTVTRANILLMVFGGFVLLTGLVSLIGMARNAAGVCFRVIYIIMAIIIFVIFALVFVMGVLVLARAGTSQIKDSLQTGWTETVSTDSAVICDLEKNLECRGFLDNDCQLCALGVEPECDSQPTCARCPNNVNPAIGCYDVLIEKARQYALPVTIVSGVVSLIVLIDIFLTCCL